MLSNQAKILQQKGIYFHQVFFLLATPLQLVKIIAALNLLSVLVRVSLALLINLLQGSSQNFLILIVAIFVV